MGGHLFSCLDFFETALVYYVDAVSIQVMPYSTGCKTVLSNFEAGQNYKVCNWHNIWCQVEFLPFYSVSVIILLSTHNTILITQDVPDPEIMVSFPIIDDPHNASFVAWTTTPWTLPSNLALCVNGNFDYVKVSYFWFLVDLVCLKILIQLFTVSFQLKIFIFDFLMIWFENTDSTMQHIFPVENWFRLQIIWIWDGYMDYYDI